MKLSKEILDKYNNLKNPTDNELIYVYCLYYLYDYIGRKLPETSISNYFCAMQMYSLRNTLRARNLDPYKFHNFEKAIKFIKKFEESDEREGS